MTHCPPSTKGLSLRGGEDKGRRYAQPRVPRTLRVLLSRPHLAQLHWFFVFVAADEAQVGAPRRVPTMKSVVENTALGWIYCERLSEK